jgi:hypothetical protein
MVSSDKKQVRMFYLMEELQPTGLQSVFKANERLKQALDVVRAPPAFAVDALQKDAGNLAQSSMRLLR